MNKRVICILCIIIAILAIVAGVAVFNKIKVENDIENNLIVSKEIIDECTEEWNNLNADGHNAILETNSNEEKISPNCMMIIKRNYKKCGHTINEYKDVPEELINKTKSDLENKYLGYQIEKYTSSEIVLYKECEGECGEHFILKESDNGKIVIYKINENNKEILYKETEISVDYITETDKINIKNGLKVFGIEELNQVIEDFE